MQEYFLFSFKTCPKIFNVLHPVNRSFLHRHDLSYEQVINIIKKNSIKVITIFFIDSLDPNKISPSVSFLSFLSNILFQP